MDVNALNTGIAAAMAAEIPAMHFMDNPLSLPEPPSFVLFDFTTTTHKTMRFASQIEMTLRIIVGRQDPQAGATATRGLAGDGAGTPFYAIEKPHILPNGGAQTLGGACDDCIVTSIQGYRLYRYAGVDYLGFEMMLTAIGERAS